MNRHSFFRSPPSPGGSAEAHTGGSSDEGREVEGSPALIAEKHWETKWLGADSAFDPAYERTNAALRRWVDGMEQALTASISRRLATARATR